MTDGGHYENLGLVPFGTGHAFHSLNSRLTAGAVVRGIIKYPAAADLGENDTGLLIVAKAVLWQDLPDWVLTYGAGKSGESFPNDKTSDQWFNEAAEEPIPPEELHPRWCTPEPTAKAPDRQRPASPWPRPSVL